MKISGIALSAGVLALAGCNSTGGSTSSADAVTAATTASPTGGALSADPASRLSSAEIRQLYSQTACDSLTGSTTQISSSYDNGLRGYITVPKPGVDPTTFTSLDSFESDNAYTLPSDIFMSQLNVPTRSFNEGFPTLGGALLQNGSGQPLIEWFRIDFDGFIQLGNNMVSGNYEFAIIADDGAQLQLGTDYETYLSSPNTEQSTLICGNDPIRGVNLVQGQTLPMKVQYFQGPRYNIALQLLWRPAGQARDPACGQAGNGLWFDYTQVPSVPQPAYNDLLARGWSVVPPESFRIPDDALVNPCQSVPVQTTFGNCTATSCGGLGI